MNSVVFSLETFFKEYYGMEKIEFMAASGCKFIYLDHITLAVSEVDGSVNESMDKLMSDLLKCCKKFDVWIGVVSHLRKTGSGAKTFEEGANITEDALLTRDLALSALSFSTLIIASTLTFSCSVCQQS